MTPDQFKYLRFTFRMLQAREDNNEELEIECEDVLDVVWDGLSREERDVVNTLINILDEEMRVL